MVAAIPGSMAVQVSSQSITASPESPFEKDERCKEGLLSSSSHTRIISLIASVLNKREKFDSCAKRTEAVDFPTPVAPAMTSKRGALPEMVRALV